MTRCCADCAAMRAWRALLAAAGEGRTGTIVFDRATVTASLRIGQHTVSSAGVSLVDAVRDVAIMTGEIEIAHRLDAEREALRRAATIPAPSEDEREVPRC